MFSEEKRLFNMCKLLAGSEGTLAFTTQITLKLDKLPPSECMMVAAHFESIDSCLEAVTLSMKHNLFACEMIDKTILDLTKHNKTQQVNRQFIQGDPKAILLCELRADNSQTLEEDVKHLIVDLQSSGLSYAYPVLKNEDINKANELRKAGLGLLGNMIGDEKNGCLH